MARLLVCYAHPGHKHSHVNKYMASAAAALDGITFVDLYSDYPRFDIDVDAEQQRLLDHDVILFQFPLFWYSTPSIVKEWQDLVLEHGFAYGKTGRALEGKRVIFLEIGLILALAFVLMSLQWKTIEKKTKTLGTYHRDAGIEEIARLG